MFIELDDVPNTNDKRRIIDTDYIALLTQTDTDKYAVYFLSHSIYISESDYWKLKSILLTQSKAVALEKNTKLKHIANET